MANILLSKSTSCNSRLQPTLNAASESEPGMDGFKLLEQDHDRVKRLCNELNEQTSDQAIERRKQLFAEIEGEVKLHEECEEKVLYPTLRAHAKLKDIVLEGYQEHHVVDVILGELRNLSPSDEMWPAK